MQQTHLFCFLASYGVAFLLELIRLWKASQLLRWLSLGFTIAGVVAQVWYLLGRSYMAQLPPLLASTHDWLLVAALLLVVCYVLYSLVDFKREGYTSLGLFVLPAALLIVGAASLVRNSPNRLLETERFWRMLHASSLVIGITGVLIGFLISLMYLLQHRRLKLKIHLQEGFSLPPLASLARYNRWAIIGSVPMLTIGLLSGIRLVFQARRTEVSYAWTDPIILVFSVLWCVMVLLFFWLIRAQSAYGRQVAILTAWACGFLVITIVSLQVLSSVAGLPTQHGGMLGN